MTYIKIEQAHTDDARWLAAGADAFAVHVAALVYCDRQLLDGCIPRAMALRVSLAVPPHRGAAAVDALLAVGFWTEVATGYLIENYADHAFPAEQIKRTRKRWQQDKERRRQHDLGDHALCKDPKFCPAIREGSTVESTAESTGGRSHPYPTRPDQTRPEGSGKGMGGAQAGSAGATPAGLGQMAALYVRSSGARRGPRPPRVSSAWTGMVADPTPWDVRIEAEDYDEPSHRGLTVWPAVTAREFFALPAADRQAADQSWRALARLMVEEVFPALVAEVRGHHPVGCVTDDGDDCCRITAGTTANDWRDPIRGWDPWVWAPLPTEDAAAVGAQVGELLTELFAEIGADQPTTEFAPTLTAPSEERR